MMFGIGTTEMIVIGLIVFFIFGARRLPEIGKGLGGAVKEFRNIKKDLKAGDSEIPENKGKNTEGEKASRSPELMEQIPGVKKAMEVKKKVEQVKKLVE